MPDYVELHCHSHFSLRDGVDAPERLVARAAALGMDTLALTDHDALYGAVPFARAAAAHAIRPIFGAELTLHDDTHLTLLVQGAAGWANLCDLLSLAHRNAPKGQARLPADALAGRTAGLIALSGCRRGRVAGALWRRQYQQALDAARALAAVFPPGQLGIELQQHRLPGDDWLVAELAELAAHLRLPTVLTNNVHYATPAGRRLHDVLTSARQRTTLGEAGTLLRANGECYLKDGRQLAALLPPHLRSALATSRQLAERCDFALAFGLQDLPVFPVPAGMTPSSFLAARCREGLHTRPLADPDAAASQLAEELRVIDRAGLTNYLLIVWDIVRFCKEQGIRCQGRGSAASALVAYLLEISPIDPLAHRLEFGRFLSPEHPVLPDIDLDIQADRREAVIQYVYARYGTDHAAMACTYVTLRARGARREVAQALGPAASDELLVEALQAQLLGLPRHLGIHNGGMVLTGPPLHTRLPTEPATMPGRTVVQWDKQALEDAGLVKIDLLGLRTLGMLAEAEALVRATSDPTLRLDALQPDDPAVYAMLCRGDSIGVFQVESRAQTQLLPRLRPTCFADLIVAISLIRPGPIQGAMVHPYLRRRAGVEPVRYAHPSLEPALGETLGVILFQEQVLKVARALAGFSPGQGERLRRALGAKQPGPELERLQGAFLAGAAARGVREDVAATVYGQLAAFAGYAFPKSHAAAFAVLVYQAAWLKRYHPLAFYTALLNHQPMGFWSPAVIVGDARRHGVTVRGVDIQQSAARCTIEDGALRLGLGSVRSWGEAAIGRLLAARERRPFADLNDLCRRTRLPKALLQQLIQVGGLDSWGARRQLLWQLGGLRYAEDELDLVVPLDAVELPALSRGERLSWTYAGLGLSTDDHPLALCRPWLAGQGIRGTRDLAGIADGARARLAGLLVVHQAPPTAKGHHFLTLEDEDGIVDIIVRPHLVARAQACIAAGPLLIAAGVVQRRDGVTTLVAEGFQTLVLPGNMGA